MADEQRRTIARRSLQQQPRFNELSPEVGELDLDAAARSLSDDIDETLSVLADMASATDVRLRKLAQRLAARVVVDLAESAGSRRRGIGRIRSLPLTELGGDLDVESSMDALVTAQASGMPPNVEELKVRAWTRPDSALVILIDRSGSMKGDRVATAAVAAAAAAHKTDTDYAIVAFNDNAVVLKAMGQNRPVEEVVNDVLRLRGSGSTDLSLALRVAASQLNRSGANVGRTVLLSDCRPTEGSEPHAAASGLDHLGILAPDDDYLDAKELADNVGARWARLSGPSDVPAAFRSLTE